jgi:dolichol-phosphate mannosyltransferase
VKNTGKHGFGWAIRFGLERFAGESVCVMMADGSDPPEDLIRFHRSLLAREVDCVFGSRAIRGAKVVGYPPFKWCMNRAANLFLCVVFGYRYNDTTNPFKLYRRAVIGRIAPFTSTGFELEIEIPLKAIISGATYSVAPNGWNGREEGASKMKMLKLVGPYLRVVRDCLALRRATRRSRP